MPGLHIPWFSWKKIPLQLPVPPKASEKQEKPCGLLLPFPLPYILQERQTAFPSDLSLKSAQVSEVLS